MVTQTPDGGMEFRFFRPEARQVHLAGDFNGWHETSLTMLKDDAGWWHCRLGLSPGLYQFRYLADEKWFCDYASFGLEQGPFGWNSVLKVDAPVPTLPKTDRQAA